MKQTIILLCSALFFGTAACAQSEKAKSVKKVKIIIVDENGVKKEIVKEISETDKDIHWTTDDKHVKILVNRGDGEDEEIEIDMNGDGDQMVFKIDGENDFTWETKDEMSNKAFLGVQPAEDVKDVDGVMVMKAVKGSAAEEAGMQTGDVITKIDDQKIDNFEDLKAALAKKEPGDEITVTYARQGKSKTTKVALKSMSNENGKVTIKKEVKIEEKK